VPVPDDSDIPQAPSDPDRDPEGGEGSLSTALEQDGGKEAAPGIRSDQPRFRRWLTIRDDPGGIERLLLGLACILSVLLVWHILTRGDEVADRIVGPLTLPSLEETAKSFPSLWFDRALMRAAFASLSRVLGGFLLAAAIAIPLGVIGGCYPRFHAFLRPLSIFGRNTPVACLIPLTLIWFGLGDLQKVMFIFLAAWAFIFFDTIQSVRGIAGNYLDTAYTLGARTSWKSGLRRALLFGLAYAVFAVIGLHWVSETAPSLRDYANLIGAGGQQETDFSEYAPTWADVGKVWLKAGAALVGGFLLWFPIHSHQAVSKVLFPLALPHIVNSMRLLFGLAFGYIVLAELINAKLGLGNIILISQRRTLIEHIYLVLIAITLIAYSIDRLILWIQRRAFPYVTHGN
jgi:ABC-type nitrate/sulfonate/bicarbonate transport system permease component